MPQKATKNNCKDLLIFPLHSQIPRGTLRSFGVLRFGASTKRKFRVPGMFERESQLVLGTTIWHIARVAPSIIQNPIASRGQFIPIAWTRRVYV